MKEPRNPSAAIRRQLATNLRRLRRARGYSPPQLAQLCAFEPSYIADIEQETVNITLANLEALSNGLGCTAEELLLPIDGPGDDPKDFFNARHAALGR